MMRQLLFLLLLLVAFSASAQTVEAVDSTCVENGDICHAVTTQVNDTVSTDSMDCAKSLVSQIPLEMCDSLMARDVTDRYGVVYKGGKCGIYDLVKHENVTRIEYKELWFSFRREIEGEYYSYFGWDEDNSKGVIGVAEANNRFIAISMPKKRDEDDRK